MAKSFSTKESYPGQFTVPVSLFTNCITDDDMVDLLWQHPYITNHQQIIIYSQYRRGLTHVVDATHRELSKGAISVGKELVLLKIVSIEPRESPDE